MSDSRRSHPRPFAAKANTHRPLATKANTHRPRAPKADTRRPPKANTRRPFATKVDTHRPLAVEAGARRELSKTHPRTSAVPGRTGQAGTPRVALAQADAAYSRARAPTASASALGPASGQGKADPETTFWRACLACQWILFQNGTLVPLPANRAPRASLDDLANRAIRTLRDLDSLEDRDPVASPVAAAGARGWIVGPFGDACSRAFVYVSSTRAASGAGAVDIAQRAVREDRDTLQPRAASQ